MKVRNLHRRHRRKRGELEAVPPGEFRMYQRMRRRASELRARARTLAKRARLLQRSMRFAP